MSNNTNQNQKTTRTGATASLTSVILLAVILIAINYIASVLVLRADMTAENLYTLTDGTRSILQNLQDKVKIKFYFSRSSENVPFNYKLYGKRIEEFLGEYVSNSNGRVELEILDPQPDTDVEEWAVKYGLAGAALPTGDKFYLGMVAVSADKEEVIPFFTIEREEFLEYDISRAIVQASISKKPVIGILSSLPVLGPDAMPMQMPNQQQNDWLFVKELKKNYQVREIQIETDVIDKNIDLLMVVHPKKLPEQTLYAIDQFVVKGGRAIVMVDPASMADNPKNPVNPYMGMMSRSSDLPRLLKAWGVEYTSSMLSADMNLATRLNMGQHGMAQHPLWLNLSSDCFNRDSAVSGKLNNMLLPTAGSLKKAADSKYEFMSLIETTKAGNKIQMMKLMTPVDQIQRELKSDGEKFTLAAIVRGKFASAFAKPPEIPASEEESEQDKKQREAKYQKLAKEHITEAQKEVSIMVVADTDFLQNDYSVRAVNFFGSVLLQPINDNLAFIANAADMLAGSSDLIKVRSRNKSNRTFTKVEEIERQAQQKWQQEEVGLTKKLEEIQSRINQLQSQKKGGERLILSAQQREEIQKARKEQSETMRRRREIRKLLRQDIESLGMKITFVNLVLMPLIVMIVGTIVYFRQNSRRSML